MSDKEGKQKVWVRSLTLPLGAEAPGRLGKILNFPIKALAVVWNNVLL